MSKIGEALKEQREKRGLSLNQVEEETKIRSRYLEALEKEEYSLIPGRVYVKGFLRTYATFLGLNASELIEEYDKIQTEVLKKPEENIPTRRKKKEKPKESSGVAFKWDPRYNKYLAIAGAVIILALVNKFYPWGSPDTARRTPPTDQITREDVIKERVEDQIDDERGENPPVQQEPQAPQRVNLRLNAEQGSSWMRVTVDGSVAFEGTIAEGESKDFEGEEKVAVRIGNAGAINVVLNGESLGPIGNRGQVVSREFTRNQE